MENAGFIAGVSGVVVCDASSDGASPPAVHQHPSSRKDERVATRTQQPRKTDTTSQSSKDFHRREQERSFFGAIPNGAVDTEAAGSRDLAAASQRRRASDEVYGRLEQAKSVLTGKWRQGEKEGSGRTRESAECTDDRGEKRCREQQRPKSDGDRTDSNPTPPDDADNSSRDPSGSTPNSSANASSDCNGSATTTSNAGGTGTDGDRDEWNGKIGKLYPPGHVDSTSS